ncbi:MAG TPA: efflux RND transporter periplasmic adaptor subunit [Steroidobacteraceae bacterium]|jgi:HlyD family secretion protein|nr:efflux RND transporter periplasmic adaptor subunit [Steroidobacteraceae bacterium]
MTEHDASTAAMDRALARPPAWRRFVPYAAIGIIAAGIVSWLLLEQSKGHIYRLPLNRVTIATVSQGPFEDYIAVRGTVAPLIIDYLTTDQGGTVKQVLVEDGAMVKRGQKLIVLSNPALQLQVAAQQITFEQTRFKYQHDLLDIEHQISQLKGNLARDKILLDGNAIAPSTYKQEQEDYQYILKLREATIASRDAEQRVRATQLTGQAAGTQADIANAGVDALTIRAPMDGQLTALDAEVGQSKAQGAVLGQVNSADRFKLTALVDEFYLGHMSVGQESLFTLDGRGFPAKVAKVYPQVTTGTFKVDLHFVQSPPSTIHVGQAVDLKLELGGASRALIVPNGPFYQDTGGNWAFVIAPDGTYAERRNIRLGRRNPDYVEVVDGLRPGEKIIVSGYEAFQKMDRVEFEKPENQ